MAQPAMPICRERGGGGRRRLERSVVIKRCQQGTFEPVTLGHIQAHGCRDLLIYCVSGSCHDSATMNAD
jgi:hypothetical protein